MATIDLQWLQAQLTTVVVGRELQYHEQVGSTNDLLKQAARQGVAEGVVIIAEEQTAGRGRLGRGWVAPPGLNLLNSILLRPQIPMSQAFSLTMLASVALAEAVEAQTALQARLKWPNDLMIPVDGSLRKAAGILSELEVYGGRISWAVLGIGLNVNWSPTVVLDGRDLAASATNLAQAVGHPLQREPLAAALYRQLEYHYLRLRQHGPDELFEQWRDRLATLGQTVTIQRADGVLIGLAEAVLPDGALLIRDTNGLQHTILTGDVGG